MWQDTLPLKLGDTTCVIYSKALENYTAVCKNLLQEQNQVAFTVINQFV